MKSKWIKYDRRKQRLQINGTRIQNLNRRELEVIRSNRLPSILNLSVEKDEPPVCLTADITELVPLSDYLKTVTLTKKLFAHIVNGIVRTVSDGETLKFNKDLFLYSTEYVLIGRRTLSISMLYIPLQPFDPIGSLTDLLRGIVREAHFDTSESQDYIKTFLEVIGHDAPSSYVLGEYINYIKQEITAVQKKRFDEFPSDVMHAALRDKQTEKLYSISVIPFRVGKQLNISDFQIESHLVSRTHAKIEYEQGCYFLVDLASKNGTYLNGQRIQQHTKVKLHKNDTIRFADMEYTFVIEEE